MRDSPRQSRVEAGLQAERSNHTFQMAKPCVELADLFVDPKGLNASTQFIIDSNQCNICREVACEPVETACGHLFGHGCLMGWASRTGDKFKCPACNKMLKTVSSAKSWVRSEARRRALHAFFSRQDVGATPNAAGYFYVDMTAANRAEAERIFIESRRVDIELLKQADKLGHPEAPCILGHRHLSGNGVEKSADLALSCFIRASNRGFTDGGLYAADELMCRNDPEADAEIKRLIDLAESKGGRLFDYVKFKALNSGRGFPKDGSAALVHLQRSSSAGHPAAMFVLGKRNHDMNLVSLAYNHNIIGAALTLGRMHIEAGNPNAALTVFMRGHAWGCVECTYNVGMMYIAESSSRLDGQSYLRTAAGKGHPDASYQLALMAAEDEQTFMRQASERGHKDARRWVEERDEHDRKRQRGEVSPRRSQRLADKNNHSS